MDDTKIQEMQTAKDETFNKWQARLERAEKIANVSNLIEKPKGFWTKRCPVDNSKLKTESFSLEYYEVAYYKCQECDYEYARFHI